MIPVRVPAALMPVLANERRFNVRPEHPLYEELCPVCDGLLGETLVVLVFAGIEPQERKQAGVALGGAVAVHAFCAGAPAGEPKTRPATVTIDLSDPDALHVFTTALQDYAEKERDMAKYEGGNESRERWAAIADRMRAQAEAGS